MSVRYPANDYAPRLHGWMPYRLGRDTELSQLFPYIGFRIDLLHLGGLQTFTLFSLLLELFDGLELHIKVSKALTGMI